jgi:hypothetical protein
MAASSSERWLWQLSIHFELLPLEMMHRVVIQATDGNFASICFQHNLYLIKRCAGEYTATNGSHLNDILSTARRVIFKGLNSSFAHLPANALTEVAVYRITQPGLMFSAAMLLQFQAACGAHLHVEDGLSHRAAAGKGTLGPILKHQFVVRPLQQTAEPTAGPIE